MERKPKIAIAGYRGLIGSILRDVFKERGHELLLIGRAALYGDPKELAAMLEGTTVVINLAGAPMISRWTKSHREAMYNSRILTTRALATAFLAMEHPPALFISVSGVAIYEDYGINSESNALISNSFLGSLCQDWEKEAHEAAECCRVVIFRLGVVLHTRGGALARLLPFFRAGLGGSIGHGRQFFPWVHAADVSRAFLFVIENQDMAGVFNLTAPQVINNKQFTVALAAVLKRPALLPIPAFVLSLLFGKGSQVLTTGQGVVPARLQEAGFSFHFPAIREAMEDLLAKP